MTFSRPSDRPLKTPISEGECLKNGNLPAMRTGKQALLLVVGASLVVAQTACSRGAAKVDRTYAQPPLLSSDASAALGQQITALGQGFDGDIGIDSIIEW